MNYFINIMLSDLKRKKNLLLFFLIAFIILEIGIYYFSALKTDYNFFFGAYDYKENALLCYILKIFKVIGPFYLYYYLTINDFKIHYSHIFVRLTRKTWLKKKMMSYFIIMLILKTFNFLFCLLLYHKIPPLFLLFEDLLLDINIILCNFLYIFSQNTFFKILPLASLFIFYFYIGLDKIGLYIFFNLFLFSIPWLIPSNMKLER